MTVLVGLMDNQEEVERAVNALTASQGDDVDIRTIETWPDGGEPVINALPVAEGFNTAAAVSPLTAVPSLSDLDQEEIDYFRRNVQNGGVLLMVQMDDDDDDLPEVQRILQDHSVKMTSVK